MMLEHIESAQHECQIFRLVNQVEHVVALAENGIDAEGIREMIEFLKEAGLGDDLNEVLDSPFLPKNFLKPKTTRFSDGSLRVFYSALEAATAEQEIQYWFLKPLIDDSVIPLRAHYRCVSCTFSGSVKDLRPHVVLWPFLVSDAGYPQCNVLGAEAAGAGLNALISRSARSLDGTTVPVFSRPCLSNPEFQDYRIFEYDPVSKAVNVHAT